MLNILFLNCFLRPNFIFNDNQKERIKYIPSYTIKNNKSLIGLCEVFYNTNLRRLEREYKIHMEEFITESGISLQSTEGENVLLSMAKSITNAITNEGVEMECLHIGIGKTPNLGLSFLAEEKNKNTCIKFATKLQEICVLQKELQKTLHAYCSVVQ